MDQRERSNNFEESVRAMVNGFLSEVWTALPGIVQSFDATKMTVVVQPTIQAYVRNSDGTQSWTQIKNFVDVPVVFPCAGGFALTLPIAAGDEVLVIFASRCIDQWWQSGDSSIQAVLRMHDIGDGFAIPGPQSVPRVLSSVSTQNAQLRTRDGSCYIEITPSGVVNIVAPGGVNITGDVNITGSVVATEEGTFNGGHTVSEHVHGGVQPGGADTDTPTG